MKNIKYTLAKNSDLTFRLNLNLLHNHRILYLYISQIILTITLSDIN